jgi:hypothetical protein
MDKAEKQKRKEEFRAMNRHDKMVYLWDYYKWGIMAAGVVFLGLIYLIATPAKPKMETYVNVTFIGNSVNTRGTEEFAAELNKNLPGLSETNKRVDVQAFVMGESADPMMTMGNMQKLAALIMSSEIDVLVGDEAQLVKFAGEDGALPLNDYYTREEQKDLNIVSFNYEPDSTKVTYIDLSSSSKLKKMIPAEKIGMILMSNSIKTEEARQLMDYLLTLE